MLLKCATVHYPSIEQSKYSNCTVTLSEYDERKSGDTLPSPMASMLNSLLWLRPDAIINTHDTMQNLGQTWIFYKLV